MKYVDTPFCNGFGGGGAAEEWRRGGVETHYEICLAK